MTDCRVFRRLVPIFALALIAAPLAAASRAAEEVSEARAVSGFDGIRTEGAFETEITAGGGRTQVVVSADRDVISRVTTEVRDGTLVVGMQSSGAFFHQAPRLTITLPVLRKFSNAGAGSARITGLTGVDVEFENAGAASLVASGRAAREDISLDGAGKIDTTAVNAHDVSVNNNGVGTVRVRASGVLSMNVNGVGEIRYTGDPAHIESHVNGIGRIERL